MKKVLWAICLVLVLASLVAIPVYATVTAYTANLTVQEDTGTSYTRLPLSFDIDNSTLVSLGYMQSDGLDVLVKDGSGNDLPTMVCTDKTLFADAIAVYQNETNTYTTGNTARASMDIVTGYGGYITTADAAALEPASSFMDDISYYVDPATPVTASDSVGAYYCMRDLSAVAAIVDDTTDINDADANDVMVTSPAGTSNTNTCDYFGFATFPQGKITINLGTSGDTTCTWTWEYFASDGTWAALSDVVDGTDNFEAAPGNHDVTFDIPSNAVPGMFTSNGSTVKQYYYIRARCSGGGTITTAPLITQAWGCSKNVLSKSGAYQIGVYDSTHICASIAGSTTAISSNTDDAANIGVTDTTWKAYNFTPAATTEIGGVVVYAYASANPRTLTCSIRTTAAGLPSDADLTSGTVVVRNTDSRGWRTISFSSPITLTGGTTYAMVFRADSSNIQLRGSSVAVGAGRSTSADSGANWAAENGKIDHYTFAPRIGLLTESTDGEHEVSLSLSGGTLSLQLDSEAADTTSCNGGVQDTANDFIIGGNNSTPYLGYWKHTVSGVEVLKYQPNTIISGTTLPDRDTSDGTQNGTITFGTNPEDITLTLGSLYPSSLNKAQLTSASTDMTYPTATPTAPAQLYTEMDTDKIPGADVVNAILGVSDTPESLFWFPFIFLGLLIFSFVIFEHMQTSGGEGSLLTLFIAIESGLVFFGILGTAGVSSMLPLWPAYLFPIFAIGVCLSKKHIGWG